MAVNRPDIGYIPGFTIYQLSPVSFWFERDDGEGMEVSIETMEKIFKEFM